MSNVTKARSLSLGALVFLVLLLFCPACGEGQGVQELECTMGYPDLDARFTTFSQGDDAEIVLGFQGFVFTRLLLQVPAKHKKLPKFDVDLSIGVENDEPFGGTQLGVDFERDETTNEWVSEEMYLYLSPAIVDQFKDRDAVITLNLHGPNHYCTATMPVYLVDSDPCIHTGGISFLCPEDEP